MNPPCPGPSPPSRGIPSPPAPGHPSPPSLGHPSPPAQGIHPHLPQGIHPHLPLAIPTFPGHPSPPAPRHPSPPAPGHPSPPAPGHPSPTSRGIHPHLPGASIPTCPGHPSPPAPGHPSPPAPGHPHLPQGIHPHLPGPSPPSRGIHPHLPRAVLTCPGPFTPTCPGLFSPVGAVPRGIGALSSPGQVESSRPAAPQCFRVPLPVVPGEAAAEPVARGGAGVPGASRSCPGCPISIPSFAPLARQLREPAGSRNLVLIWRGFFCKKHAKKKERQQKLPGEGAQGPAPPAPPGSLSRYLFLHLYIFI
uniref:splicing factor 3A subunit 2-like isoform X12 n=1 Tax=Agelaius phoeniceus TaxID=39638 RepID=UPI0023EC8E4C|nr:splicing factor 3A subunit 2-like isoform X12 [Agelaius phoeniceus]